MGNSWFQFQQFRINQDRSAMKISTDAVLLGALAKAENPVQILDIGTGTGVIALMLAQRFPQAKITALELDDEAAGQARENFEESSFADRLKVFAMRIQDFESTLKFDLIVSNPPYFPDHLKSSNQKRKQALHTDQLSFEELIQKSSELLSERGSFWVILPPRQMTDFMFLAEKDKLFLSEIYQVQDSPSKAVHRQIAKFTGFERVVSEGKLLIKNADGTPHNSYKDLISGFLLNF
jgi:tRNA1Val (adenine37-N6)-methyltransferase